MFGLFVGLFLMYFISITNRFVYLILISIGSLLPDVDHPKSKIGNLARPFSYLFEHRGFFHSIFPLIAFYFLIKFNFIIFFPLGMGYVSHIIIDMATKQGILLIHPIINIRISGVIRTGKKLELLIFYLLVFSNFLLALGLFG